MALEASYLAQMVATVTYVLSPQRIVMGGGVSQLPGLLEAVRIEARDLVAGALGVPQLASEIDDYLVPPHLGQRAGVLGALALAADRAGDR